MSSDAVERYFDRWYPDRESALSGRVVRRGQAELHRLIADWLPPLEGRSVLDAGCGDGALLAELLCGDPERIRLEDLSARQVELARRRLAGRARLVEGFARDARVDDGARFDVTLAIGVLDYHEDPASLLAGLAARTRGVLIFDAPRSDRVRHRVRQAWLRAHGIALHTFTDAGFGQLVAALSPPHRIETTRYSRVARAELG